MGPPDQGARPVLIVDGDLGISTACADLLECEGLTVLQAVTGHQGLGVLEHKTVSLVLFELNLSDLPGLEVLRRGRSVQPQVPFIVVTGVGSPETAFAAGRLGALEYLVKPLRPHDLLEIVRRHVCSRSLDGRACSFSCAPLDREHHDAAVSAAARWARAVTTIIDSRDDIKTIDGWGRAIGASRGTIKNWCLAAQVGAKRSLEFARLLRAVALSQTGLSGVSIIMDSDVRTVARLLARAGLRSGQTNECGVELSVDRFLAAQTLVTSSHLISATRMCLAARPSMSCMNGYPSL